MPVPFGFTNLVRLITGAPISATEINAEIATQNAANYWFTSLEFIDANNAVALFSKFDATAYGYTADQKVNTVAATQVAIDADIAAEVPNGYMPTGLFITPGGSLLILYQLINEDAIP